MSDLRKCAQDVLDAVDKDFDHNSTMTIVRAIQALRAAIASPEDMPPTCKPHPDAPHGFNRNASHSEDRYVCECEGWEPETRSIDALIAEIDGLEVQEFEISRPPWIEEAYHKDDIKPILDKYRARKGAV